MMSWTEEEIAWNDSSGPASDRPVIGWSCSYTPEELLLAGGFTPSRLPTWKTAARKSDSPLWANLCPYVHRIYQLGRDGGFQSFSGLVLALSCDSMRRLADACEARLRPGFVYRLDVPRRSDSAAVKFFRVRLLQLKDFLQAETGRRIRDEDLFQSIEQVNRTRRLVHDLADLKARHPHVMSFRELQSVCWAAQSQDKPSINREMAERLDRLQADARAADEPRDFGPRLLIWGCPLEDDGLVRAVEEAGGQIVAGELCTGTRHFRGLVETDGEPLHLLARRYLHRVSCSRMTGAQARIEGLKETILARRCDGVICHTLTFCDLTQSDIPRLKRDLEALGVPALQIESQGPGEDAGQLRTRIEAFLEMLRAKMSGSRGTAF